MGFIKRYVVAVVGVTGSPADSQRSEVGSYRSEAAARQAGGDEWRRILFVHAPHVDRYRVVIEHDGSEISEVPMPEVPADAAPGILDETVTPLGIPLGAAGESLRDQAPKPDETHDEVVDVAAVVPTAEDPPVASEVLESTGEMAVVSLDDLAPPDAEVTGQHPVVANGDVSVPDVAAADLRLEPVATTPPAAAIDEPPEGPVPEEIIARFAEAVRGQEERAAKRERERGK